MNATRELTVPDRVRLQRLLSEVPAGDPSGENQDIVVPAHMVGDTRSTMATAGTDKALE